MCFQADAFQNDAFAICQPLTTGPVRRVAACPIPASELPPHSGLRKLMLEKLASEMADELRARSLAAARMGAELCPEDDATNAAANMGALLDDDPG